MKMVFFNSNGMKKIISHTLILSLIQAVAAGIFVWLWLIFMMNLERFFNTGVQPTSSSFIVVPLMFIIVAVLAGGSVLGYPLYLILQGKWGRATTLLLLTLLWLGIFSTILVFIY